MTNNSFIIKTSQIKTMKKLLLPLRNVAKNKSYFTKFTFCIGKFIILPNVCLFGSKRIVDSTNLTYLKLCQKVYIEIRKLFIIRYFKVLKFHT